MLDKGLLRRPPDRNYEITQRILETCSQDMLFDKFRCAGHQRRPNLASNLQFDTHAGRCRPNLVEFDPNRPPELAISFAGFGRIMRLAHGKRCTHAPGGTFRALLEEFCSFSPAARPAERESGEHCSSICPRHAPRGAGVLVQHCSYLCQGVEAHRCWDAFRRQTKRIQASSTITPRAAGATPGEHSLAISFDWAFFDSIPRSGNTCVWGMVAKLSSSETRSRVHQGPKGSRSAPGVAPAIVLSMLVALWPPSGLVCTFVATLSRACDDLLRTLTWALLDMFSVSGRFGCSGNLTSWHMLRRRIDSWRHWERPEIGGEGGWEVSCGTGVVFLHAPPAPTQTVGVNTSLSRGLGTHSSPHRSSARNRLIWAMLAKSGVLSISVGLT